MKYIKSKKQINRIAFPWEIGLYWNLTSPHEENQRPMGCPGLDMPFGTIDKPNWPYKNIKAPVYASPAMKCGLNTYQPNYEELLYPESRTQSDFTPDNRPLHEIVDELASDNEIFAEKFLESWQMMMNNGYKEGELEDAPENGWFGYYSLAQQGITITPDFASFIEANKPVWITDKTVMQ